MTVSELPMYVAEVLLYVVVLMVLFAIGKVAYGMVHKRINIADELVEKDNVSFAFAHVGYLAGLLVALGGVVSGPSMGLVADLTAVGVYGLLSIVLLLLSIVLCDKVLFPRVNMYREICEDLNAGAGVVEGSVALGSGLLIYGAVTGDSSSLIGGMLSVSLFWLFGIAVMVAALRVFNAMLPFSVSEQIDKDNVAVGVSVGGLLTAVAIIVSTAISGTLTFNVEDMTVVATEILLGLALLVPLRWLTDTILLPGQSLTDELVNQEVPNVGAAVVEAFAYIGGACILIWCL